MKLVIVPEIIQTKNAIHMGCDICGSGFPPVQDGMVPQNQLALPVGGALGHSALFCIVTRIKMLNGLFQTVLNPCFK